MGGRRRLRGEIPRRYRDHRSENAVQYRREYLLLAEELGPFALPYQREEAADVADLKVRALDAGSAWEAARTARRRGKGRRPSDREIARLRKTAALDRASAAAAHDKLRALAATHRRPASIADLVARHQAKNTTQLDGVPVKTQTQTAKQRARA
jgi:hypothetical protein